MSSFPTRLSDVTSDWIAGALGADAIDSVNITIPEPRLGYGSEIGFIDITSADASLPSRLVVKMPPQDPQIREAVAEFGAFQREAMFYRTIAPLAPVRTPKVYAIELDAKSGDGILLLEDCSHMKRFLINQSPPTPSELIQIVRSLARLHAFWWDKTEALPQDVVRPDSEVWRNWASKTQQGWVRWLKSPLAECVPDAAVAVCERLSGEFAFLQVDAWPGKNLTLTHMDFHLQNIFYDMDREDDPVVIIDWDGCHLGCGAHDLAYLLSLLPVEYRRTNEAQMLQEYQTQLVASGITDYDASAVYSDYRFGCLFATALQPVLLELSQPGDAGQKLVCSLASRQLQTVLDHDAQYLLDELR